jgi:diaminopimelate decarboxylase
MNFDNVDIKLLEKAADTFGTPLYVYDIALIERNINQLKTAASGFKLRYAVKTNPTPYLLRWLSSHIASLDVSSAGEIRHAINNGWQGKDIEFTGPAKTRHDFELALDNHIRSIVIEDISEAELLNNLGEERKQCVRILIRIAPNTAEKKFGVRLAGRPTPFGVGEDILPDVLEKIRALSHISLEGFHIYSGSQCLDDEALAEHFKNMWQLFQKAMALWGKPINELVFGAGMGIPYHDGDDELSLSVLPSVIQQIEHDIATMSATIDCYIELGRYLVGTAGYFVTRVIRLKESQGVNIAICDGGMNHNLGACGHLGGVSHRHYSMVNVTAKFDTSEQYRIAGPLCTAIDTLAHRIDLPKIVEGDLIAVGCSGSYGPTASPLLFISHALPHEIAINTCDEKENLLDVSWIALS